MSVLDEPITLRMILWFSGSAIGICIVLIILILGACWIQEKLERRRNNEL